MAATVRYVSTVDHDRWYGPKRWIRLAVYDTADQLRVAAARYRPDDEYDGTEGCFHPADTVLERHDDGTVEDVSDRHFTGVLRLSRECLHTEIVAHECIHAAATIYRMDVQTFVRLGRGCGGNEETFAYIAGHLIALVSDALYNAKVW